MNTAALAPSCWVPGCPRPRLDYGHACADHDPTWRPAPPTRCQRPLRCYCDATPECLGHVDNLPTWAKPGPMPPEVRAQVVQLRTRRLEVAR